MMENDDKLLTSFFAEHRQEIADNGFSRRVPVSYTHLTLPTIA